ncbi:MAG: L-aspartate oxidase [Dehalococcoidia bacterium]|nr:L-aspartate oxidase [Dehalococcoidia bacterium]
MTQRYDYIVIGSGIAGLYAALLARRHGSVCVLTKGGIDECNTRYAQGGIAAAVGSDDDSALHLQDTIAAGAGLVDAEAARILVEAAADRIHDLVDFGVPFDSTDGEVQLGREAAHSRNRILHAGGDSTGAHIELSLGGLARMSRITIKEYVQVEELVVEHGRCTGVLAMDTRTSATERFDAAAVVLATGGCGQLFRVSTNPDVTTGDGIALAYRAGAEVEDMEFIQFHPTALRMPGVPIFLISEAVRGEGGVLRNAGGEGFMPRYSEQAELAPRDVVARSIVSEMAATGTDRVYLDVRHLDAGRIRARFPQIYRYCFGHGLDITREPVPVSPAAHYLMGGVRTNTWGETTVRGLYACGEVACTGVHGANRLASNSLLETVVFAKRVVQRSLAASGEAAPPTDGALELPAYGQEGAGAPDRPSLQDLMWDTVGIVRDGDGLRQATRQLAAWRAGLPLAHDRPSHELSNLLLVGRLMAEAALLREESRGAHFRTDFPEPRDGWRRRLVFRRAA